MAESTENSRMIDYVFGDDDQPKNVRNSDIAFVLKEMEVRAQKRYDKLHEALFGNGKPGLVDKVKRLEWTLKPVQLIVGGVLGGGGMWFVERLFD